MQLSKVILALSFVVFTSAAALPATSDPQDGINPIGNDEVHIMGRSPGGLADRDGYKCKGSPQTCNKKANRKTRKQRKKAKKQRKKQQKKLKKQKKLGEEPPVTDTPPVDPPVDSTVDPTVDPPVDPVNPPPPAGTGVDTPPLDDQTAPPV